MNSYNGFSPTQRYKALRWLRNEQAHGRRAPKPECCMACGQTQGLLQEHSEDYSEPFGDHIGAYGFCFRCHMMIHCRFKNPVAWEKFKALLRQGYKWAPIYGSNFKLIVEFLNKPVAPAEQGEPRPVLVFDDMGL